MPRHVASAALSLLILVGCDRTDEGAAGEAPPGRVAAEPAGARDTPAEEATARDRACALLTEARLREAFSLGDDVQIDAPEGRYSCSFTWEKPNAEALREELRKAQAARVRDMMKRMREGETAQGLVDMMDMPSTTARVSLNFPPRPPETPEEARRAFDRALEMLQEGVTRRVKTDQVDEDVTFQADITRVSGVGDAAGWAPKLHQLTVLDGPRLWHLGVEVYDTAEEDLAAAKRLAGLVLAE